MYCGFKATYDIITNKHWPECQNYPVKCPNECAIGSVERNLLEDHLNTCPLQVVECDFSYAGCNKKLQRQDMEKHVEESTQEHLALLAAASVRMNQEFEQKLREQRNEFQGYLEQKEKETAEQLKQKDRQIEHLQESFQEQLQERDNKFQRKLHEQWQHIEALKDKLKQKDKEATEKIDNLQHQLELKTQKINSLEESVKSLHGSFYPKIFTVVYKIFCQSPDMYTHPCGYKFFIGVGSNESFVTVRLHSMPGEFDWQLP